MEKFMNLPFVKAWLKMVANFTDFKGRTGRDDYWWAILGNIIIMIVLGIICKLLGGFGSIIYAMAGFAIFVLSVAMAVRRLHDVDKPTWMIVFAIIPIACFLFLYWTIKEGDEDDNQFGPNPKYGF